MAGGVGVLLTMGDFSRMTYLSVKALRHYHEIGSPEPAELDRNSGYRLYRPSQVATAQVIRRLRELGMPLEGVKVVLDQPSLVRMLEISGPSWVKVRVSTSRAPTKRSMLQSGLLNDLEIASRGWER